MDERKYCDEHGANCKALEYLDRGLRDLEKKCERETQIKTAEIKDARHSIKYDLEKLEGGVKQGYVSKSDFEPVRKLVYGVAALILLEAIRRIFLQ